MNTPTFPALHPDDIALIEAEAIVRAAVGWEDGDE